MRRRTKCFFHSNTATDLSATNFLRSSPLFFFHLRSLCPFFSVVNPVIRYQEKKSKKKIPKKILKKKRSKTYVWIFRKRRKCRSIIRIKKKTEKHKIFRQNWCFWWFIAKKIFSNILNYLINNNNNKNSNITSTIFCFFFFFFCSPSLLFTVTSFEKNKNK